MDRQNLKAMAEVGTRDCQNAEQHGKPTSSNIGFLGGLPVQVTYEELQNYVAKFGPVLVLSFPYNPSTRRHKGFAKVFYKYRESLDLAVSLKDHTLHGVSFGFSEWVPKKNFASKKEAPSSTKLFLKFDPSIKEQALHAYFSNFGIIEKLEIKKDYLTGLSRGFGFLVFSSESEARCVLERSEVHMISRKSVVVRESLTTKQISTAVKFNWYRGPTTNHKTEYNRVNYQSRDPKTMQNERRLKEYKLHDDATDESKAQKSKRILQEIQICQPQESFHSSLLIEDDWSKPTSKHWTRHPVIDLNHYVSNLRIRCNRWRSLAQ